MVIDIYKTYSYLAYTVNLIAKTKFGDRMFIKGGTALMSKLIECNRLDKFRLTTDIDIHCSNRELWIEFYNNIEDILNNNDRGYVYKITKRRSEEKGLDKSDSLVFELADCGVTYKFKIDMNIKSDKIITVDYSPILHMSTYDVATMLTDKIVAVSSQKIFRRTKDLYDITVLVSMYPVEYNSILKHIRMKYGDIKLEDYITSENYSDIKHAYNMFNGIENKPDVRDLIITCKDFLIPFYSNNETNMVWNTERLKWETV